MRGLCAFDGLSALPTDLLRVVLTDRGYRVRRQDVRLACMRLGNEPDPSEAVIALVDDPEIRVRFELAQSLGQWNDPKAGEAPERLAARDGADPWRRAAVLSASASRTRDVLAAVSAAKLEPRARSLLLEPLIATAASVSGAQALAAAFGALASSESGAFPSWRLAVLGELLDALDRPSRSGIPVKVKLGPAFEADRALASNADADPADRVAAVRFLGADDTGRTAVLTLLAPTSPAVVQSAAVRSLTRTGGDRAPAQPPRVRA